uniref:Uncharacterized protein n=1 Tax=Leptobrachium leishanense TaxID=445787 RepID=A0A8C5M653_9ANUR
MQSVENMTSVFEPSGKPFTLNVPNILLDVTALSNVSLMDFKRTFNKDLAFEVSITSGVFQKLLRHSNVTVTNMVLRKLSRILPNNYGDTIESSDHSIGRHILINTITTRNINVREVAIEMVFTNDEHNTTAGQLGQCVFWNYTLFDGNGGWSSEGCQSFPEASRTVCRCDHLTSFSLLMSDSSTLEDYLKLISYIGVVTSIICLIIFLIIQIVEWKRKVTNTISFFHHTSMLNIALSLLIADVWFLASAFVPKKHTNMVCISATFMKHLFYLAMFFWTLFQGLILLHQMVFVFHPLSRCSVTPVMVVIGYICPLVIALVTLVIYYPSQSYIKEGTCFLNEENGALHAFSVPLLLIVLVNVFIVALVVWKLRRPSLSEGPDGEDKKALISMLKALLILTAVFGLTWMIGIITMITDVPKFFYYVFDVISFQGLFILIIGCLLDQKVRLVVCAASADFNTRTKKLHY